ncbi:MAG: hypothetical protein ABSA93_20990, partial [Streptosporangiaceae bacterium]
MSVHGDNEPVSKEPFAARSGPTGCGAELWVLPDDDACDAGVCDAGDDAAVVPFEPADLADLADREALAFGAWDGLGVGLDDAPSAIVFAWVLAATGAAEPIALSMPRPAATSTSTTRTATTGRTHGLRLSPLIAWVTP